MPDGTDRELLRLIAREGLTTRDAAEVMWATRPGPGLMRLDTARRKLTKELKTAGDGAVAASPGACRPTEEGS
jgi:hypothetical protein